MEWFNDLFYSTSIAQSILLLALTIAGGILFSKIKIFGISLGVTWILFVGLVLSHFGMRLSPMIEQFCKDFGLILFVYSIGLQVGPGFFSSFRKGGITLNLLAVLGIVLSCVIAYLIPVIFKEDFATTVGILSGAVTNTPALGAAQQTYVEVTGLQAPNIALGYAVAYPLGIIGVILTVILLRITLRINFDKEAKMVATKDKRPSAERINVRVLNKDIDNHSIGEIKKLLKREFVISRILHPDQTVEPVTEQTIIKEGDILRIVAKPSSIDTIVAFFGEQVSIESSVWETVTADLVSRKAVVTKSKINGKRICDLNIRYLYGVNVTRVTRAETELVATFDLRLQVGDVLTIVGKENAVEKVSNILGNSSKSLDAPNLFPIFLGIILGVILGSIPILLPGMPQPVKLGLAGGPLIIALLIGRYGPKYKLVTFTTTSANMMLREIGIALFLASVGLSSGAGFVDAILGGGYRWLFYGFLITVIPIFIVGIVGRKWCKLDFFTLTGMISGIMTNPIALSYVNSLSNNDKTSVAHTTVYPLSTFLRIVIAQIMILVAFG